MKKRPIFVVAQVVRKRSSRSSASTTTTKTTPTTLMTTLTSTTTLTTSPMTTLTTSPTTSTTTTRKRGTFFGVQGSSHFLICSNFFSEEGPKFFCRFFGDKMAAIDSDVSERSGKKRGPGKNVVGLVVVVLVVVVVVVFRFSSQKSCIEIIF